MEVIFYAKAENKAGKKLQGIVEDVLPKNGIKVFRDIESLSDGIDWPNMTNGQAIAVMVAVNRDELESFYSIRDQLYDLRIILVLPDIESDTIAQGHSLRPRFITYADSDFMEVGAVLKKMMEYSQQIRHVENGVLSYQF